jgi:DNA-binding NarL/FixJ family response regulator
LHQSFIYAMHPNQKTIKVIVVDDHRLFRMGLLAVFQSRYPHIHVCGEAESGDELFRLFPNTSADLVLLDVNLPDMNGVEAARRIRKEYPQMKILAISGENSAETVKAMVEAGINGFITKQQGGTDELVHAIQTVMSGMDYFGGDISFILYGIYRTKTAGATPAPTLSKREREIIELCSNGLICKEIAYRLDISVHTVNTYKERIFQKLGINNTMEMVQYALKKGIIHI